MYGTLWQGNREAAKKEKQKRQILRVTELGNSSVLGRFMLPSKDHSHSRRGHLPFQEAQDS